MSLTRAAQPASGLRRGLILDLDGTLYDADSAYAAALRAVGVDPVGEAYAQARLRVKARLPRGHVSARNRLLYFKAMLEADGNYSARAVLERTDAYEKALEGEVSSQWKALGRDALMAALNAQFTLVVLTNENARTQMVKLRAMESTQKHFAHVITSEEIGEEKPSESMYRAALDWLELPAEECWMVGDDPLGDLVPAAKLGMRTVWTREFCGNAPTVSSSLPAGSATVAKLDSLREVLSS